MGDDIKKVFERIEDALKDTGRDYMEENAPETEGDDSVDKIIDGMVDRASEKVYPCVPLRGVTIFPNTVIHFDIGRDKSIKALESAMAKDKVLFVTSQKDDNILIPTFGDLYSLGTVIRVKQMLKINGDAVRVLVEGLSRARIKEPVTEESFMTCTLAEIPESIEDAGLTVEEKAAVRMARDLFIEYAALTGRISDDMVDKIVSTVSPGKFCDKAASEVAVTTAVKQQLLDSFPFGERIQLLVKTLTEENQIAVMEKQLNQKVKENVDTNQREYFLKERMKAIQEELGDDEDPTQEADQWLKKLNELKLDETTDEKIRKEIKRFTRMMPSSAESSVIRTYVETLLDLPWNEASKLNSNLKKAEKVADDADLVLGTDLEKGTFYYTVVKAENVKLADYIEDDLAETDRAITEPVKSDYEREVTSSRLAGSAASM